MNSRVNTYGVIVAAVSGACNKISAVSNLFYNSINAVGSSMVGPNIGAHKHDRISRIMISSFVMDISIMAVLAVLLVRFSELIFNVFFQETISYQLD